MNFLIRATRSNTRRSASAAARNSESASLVRSSASATSPSAVRHAAQCANRSGPVAARAHSPIKALTLAEFTLEAVAVGERVGEPIERTAHRRPT